MGGTQSTSKVVNTVNDSIGIVNKIEQEALTATTCSSILNLNGCTINNSKIKQGQNCSSVDMKRFKAALNSVSDEQIDSEANATAIAVGQQIGFTTGTKAKTDVENTTTLMKNIRNTIQQSAVDTMQSTMTVNCTDSTVNNSVIEQDSFASLLTNTIMSADSVITSIDKLVSKATGESKAKTENTLAAIFIAIALCIAAIFMAPELGVAALGAAAPPQFTLALVTGIFVLIVFLFVWSQYNFRNTFWFPGIFEIMFPLYKGTDEKRREKNDEDAKKKI